MTPAGLTQLSRRALVRLFVLYAVLATSVLAVSALAAHRGGASPHHNEQAARRGWAAHGR